MYAALDHIRIIKPSMLLDITQNMAEELIFRHAQTAELTTLTLSWLNLATIPPFSTERTEQLSSQTVETFKQNHAISKCLRRFMICVLA
jgi:hypothetical protein